MYSRQLIGSLWNNLLSYATSRVFQTTRTWSAFRRWSLLLIGFVLWLGLALILHPYTPSLDPLNAVFYPFRALFAPDVIKHVLIVVVVFWLAYRAATIYLDDIFELKNLPVAGRFIRQAAFASRYDLVEIVEGEVSDKASPIFMIGGPGMVRVHLENAALFEKIGGQPRVLGPSARRPGKSGEMGNGKGKPPKTTWFGNLTPGSRKPSTTTTLVGDGARNLEAFEHLRSILDLRDQVETLTVFGRTRDGIRIRAEDLRVIFSVLRNGHTPTLDRPYPFNPEAVKRLVYSLPSTNWTVAMTSQIRRELGTFISKHTLSEFLAAISWLEVDRIHQANDQLKQEADQRAGISRSPNSDPQGPPPFVPRPEISDLFYDLENFRTRTREVGVELRWIGLGTWVPPDEIIPDRHLQAWRISFENLARGSRAALEALNQESRQAKLLSLVQETPLGTYHGIDTKDESRQMLNMVSLVNAYRGKLYAAMDIYAYKGQAETPHARQVREVWTHLAHNVARYIGDDFYQTEGDEYTPHKRTVVRIEIDREIDLYSEPERSLLIQELLETISSITGVSRRDIKVLYEVVGSFIITLELPDEAAMNLYQSYMNKDPDLKDWKIRDMRLSSNEIPLLPDPSKFNLEKGLDELGELIDQVGLPKSDQVYFNSLRAQLLDNIKYEHNYGWSNDNRAERNRIVWALENFVKDKGLGDSFVDLCVINKPN